MISGRIGRMRLLRSVAFIGLAVLLYVLYLAWLCVVIGFLLHESDHGIGWLVFPTLMVGLLPGTIIFYTISWLIDAAVDSEEPER
jgi:hypothetical protein